MKLVTDTNILFSFFWEDSLIKQILTSPNMEILSHIFALDELKKHSSLIINKTKISKREFTVEFNKLKSFVKFLPKEYYQSFLKTAEEISPDKSDAHFLALCLRLNLPLWSNDKELKKQNKVIVVDIKDIIDIYLG